MNHIFHEVCLFYFNPYDCSRLPYICVSNRDGVWKVVQEYINRTWATRRKQGRFLTVKHRPSTSKLLSIFLMPPRVFKCAIRTIISLSYQTKKITWGPAAKMELSLAWLLSNFSPRWTTSEEPKPFITRSFLSFLQDFSWTIKIKYSPLTFARSS